MRVCVVVPCFNEAQRLDRPAFLEFARTADPQVRLVLVDDGSRDGTGEVLQTLVDQAGDRFTLLTLPRNSGKAEAVRQGVLAALETSPEAVGYWDADLATPLSTILTFRDLLKAQPETEIVLGSRVKLLGRIIERYALRHYVGRVFATLISLSLGLATYDTQCGAKLLRVTERTPALFGRPFQTRWLFDVEILGRYLAQVEPRSLPLRAIYEYPLMCWRDVEGSKVRLRDGVISFFQLARLYLTELRHLHRDHPTVISESQ